MTATGALLHQSVPAWLRMIGRLRPGASIAGMAPRLTGVLRQWMQHDSGYPANWMPDVIRMLPKQVINVVPAGAGVAEMKEEYGRSLQILLVGLRPGAADRLRQCREPAAGPRRDAPRANRGAPGHGRHAAADYCAGAHGKRPAGDRRRLGRDFWWPWRPRACCWRWPSTARISFPSAPCRRSWSWRSAFGLALVTGVIFGAAPAWFATRTDPAEALRGAGRSTSDRSSFTRKGLLIVQATLSVVLVAGATMLARSLNKLEHQDFGYQVHRARGGGAAQSARHLHRGQAGCALPRARGTPQSSARSAGKRTGALQPAHQQLGRTDLRGRPSCSQDGRRSRRVVGPRERQLSSELWHDRFARAGFYRRGQRNHGAGGDRERRLS